MLPEIPQGKTREELNIRKKIIRNMIKRDLEKSNLP